MEGLRSGYGGVEILHGIDLSLGREVFAILGANGAGKSTFLRTLAGLLPATGGAITLDGEPITHLGAHERAARGLSYVPQERCVFPDLTVAENLSIGGLLGRRPRAARRDEVFDLFPDLRDRLHQKAGSLSGGEGQMVAFGRALMQEPRVLLLDEPTAGLSPRYVDLLFARIAAICADRDVCVLLAEQNAVRTIAMSHRVMVLNLGRVHLTGDAGALTIESVREGYRI